MDVVVIGTFLPADCGLMVISMNGVIMILTRTTNEQRILVLLSHRACPPRFF